MSLTASDGRAVRAERPAYHHLLRGAARSRRRSFAGWLVVAVGLVLAAVTSLVVTAALADPSPGTFRRTWAASVGDSTGLLLLAPTCVLAVLVAHRRSPASLISTQLRVRWHAVGPCLVIGGVAWLVPLTLVIVRDGALPAGLAALALGQIAVLLLLVPLQSASEELFFRGWLTQTVGSWCADPLRGGVLAAAVSAVVFALAHGDQSAWSFAGRVVLGLAASWLTWRTGGLEAAVVMHASSNCAVLFNPVLSGFSGLPDAGLVGSPRAFLLGAAAVAFYTWSVDRRLRAPEPARDVRPPAATPVGPTRADARGGRPGTRAGGRGTAAP